MQSISLCPSFSSYSNGQLTQMAARVVEEFDSDDSSDDSYVENSADQRGGGGGISDEFEFVIVARDSELPSHTSADEIFPNGTIQPIYPVFNRDLLLGDLNFHNVNEKPNVVHNSVSPKIRLPLRKLFLEERETTITTSSSSSSESDDLDGSAVEKYCMWTPKSAAEDHRCKKNSSAGCISKRWKLKDFLNRSNSDGSRENLVILSDSQKNQIEKKVTETVPYGGTEKSTVTPPPPCNWDGGEKQLSYSPYKQDFVRLFGNVNVLRKNLKYY